MPLTRRAAAFLLASGVFQWVVWPTFLRNIWRDDRSFSGGSPTAFLVVHAVLTGVSLLLGTGLLVLGWRGLRGRSRGGPDSTKAGPVSQGPASGSVGGR